MQSQTKLNAEAAHNFRSGLYEKYLKNSKTKQKNIFVFTFSLFRKHAAECLGYCYVSNIWCRQVDLIL